MKKLIYLIIGIIFLISITNAQEYYADTLFEIKNNGEVNITGITNNEKLQPILTQELTSKIGPIWNFKINIDENFSEYIYEIIFPQGAEIQKIKTNSNYRITTNHEQIKIIGTGNNTTLNLEVSYIIKNQPENYFLIGVLIILIIIGISFFVYKNKKQKNELKSTINYDKDSLTERQLKIIELLEKNDGKITQAEIQKILNYPKAALSRNLETLEKKEIITKQRKGITMLIKIKNF